MKLHDIHLIIELCGVWSLHLAFLANSALLVSLVIGLKERLQVAETLKMSCK